MVVDVEWFGVLLLMSGWKNGKSSRRSRWLWKEGGGGEEVETRRVVKRYTTKKVMEVVTSVKELQDVGKIPVSEAVVIRDQPVIKKRRVVDSLEEKKRIELAKVPRLDAGGVRVPVIGSVIGEGLVAGLARTRSTAYGDETAIVSIMEIILFMYFLLLICLFL